MDSEKGKKWRGRKTYPHMLWNIALASGILLKCANVIPPECGKISRNRQLCIVVQNLSPKYVEKVTHHHES